VEPVTHRILVVEDEPDMNWLIEQILQRAGYTVTAVSNAREALQQTRTNSYAVAVIDSKLPDRDGLDLAASIRQECPGAAVVLVSGSFGPRDDVVTAGLEQGLLVGYVRKPFHVHEIRQIVQEAIAQRKEGRPTDDLHSGSR
jgi:DNA-binding response OmpR family regulator